MENKLNGNVSKLKEGELVESDAVNMNSIGANTKRILGKRKESKTREKNNLKKAKKIQNKEERRKAAKRKKKLSERKHKKKLSNPEEQSKGSKKLGKQRSQLFCLCQQPYDPNRFMIGCDNCDDWFHPKCINMTVSEANSIKEYFCQKCKAKRDKKKTKKKRDLYSKKAINFKPSFDTSGSESSCSESSNADSFYLTSDDEEFSGLNGLPKKASEKRVLPIHPPRTLSLSVKEFSKSDVAMSFKGDIPELVVRNDKKRLKSMKSRLLELRNKICKICIKEQLRETGVGFAKRLSITKGMRKPKIVVNKKTLESADGKKTIIDFDMLNCASCQGRIPSKDFSAHLRICSLNSHCNVFGQTVPERLNGGKLQDIQVVFCGCPLNFDIKDVKNVKFCGKRREECIEHVGWDSLLRLKCMHQRYVATRRYEILEGEIKEAEKRIGERNQFDADLYHLAREKLEEDVHEAQANLKNSVYQMMGDMMQPQQQGVEGSNFEEENNLIQQQLANQQRFLLERQQQEQFAAGFENHNQQQQQQPEGAGDMFSNLGSTANLISMGLSEEKINEIIASNQLQIQQESALNNANNNNGINNNSFVAPHITEAELFQLKQLGYDEAAIQQILLARSYGLDTQVNLPPHIQQLQQHLHLHQQHANE